MHDAQEAVRVADRRIRPHIPETPARVAPSFGREHAATVYLKEEHRLPTGSFKLRGAFNALLSLPDEARRAGVVAASSGNHGAAVSFAAATLGIRATVYVPEGASPAKVDKIRSHGATVVFFGTDGLDTEVEARGAAKRTGAAYVSPYNDPAVMAGQGTIALELLRQVPALDRVYVAVGGGGLIGGIATVFAGQTPQVEVVGVLPENSPVMAVSVRTGRIVEMESRPTLSDGTAGGIEADAITFPVCRDHVQRWVTVGEDEIAESMRWWAANEPGVIEGAAGVALAALRQDAELVRGRRVAVVICGGNIAADRWNEVTR